MLQATTPEQIVTGLGGDGVAATYDSGQPGPHILLRCELDAYRSRNWAMSPIARPCRAWRTFAAMTGTWRC
jgi:metal-dependent amidase/aminoacylase/carboxypeptidase family protein